MSILNKKNNDENVFDLGGVHSYLFDRKLLLFIWIGEDATRIPGKIESNVTNNKAMGFVHPLKNTAPHTEAFKALTASKIDDIFRKVKKPNYAHLIMA